MKEEIQKKKDPIPKDIQPVIDLTEEQLGDIQMKDKFIKNLVNRIVSEKTTLMKALLFRKEITEEVHL